MKRINLRDLIKPKKIDFEGGEGNTSYGKFVVEPLERGYGVTLGNGLRRILLSSLQGAAITAIKVDNVVHEFSTIQGVIEDVTHLVLNFKEVVVNLEGKDEAHVRLEAKGPGPVKAGAISGDSAVQILNPELQIATLGEGASLSVDITVKSGRGYSPADRNRVEGVPAGTIFIDAIFSPIRRVNVNVTNARVGQRTDYDKLTMEIWTDGSIDPRTAIAESSHILMDQFSAFVGEGIIVEDSAAASDVDASKKPKLNDNLYRKIEEIELSVRSANCLENADIKYMGELVSKTEAEMLRTKNFGRKSLNEIKEILVEMGLHLGMKLDGFPSRKDLDAMASGKPSQAAAAHSPE
jgi:DNA-directed RNA polymerase subunit alpha